MDAVKRQKIMSKVNLALSKITYKQGASFRALDLIDSVGFKIMRENVEDSDGTGLDGTLLGGLNTPIGAFDVDQSKVDTIVKTVIQGVARLNELHECDEWLKFNGRSIANAHDADDYLPPVLKKFAELARRGL